VLFGYENLNNIEAIRCLCNKLFKGLKIIYDNN